jgi:hypothetical protein
VLYAMSVIVVNVERTRLWICAGEVSFASPPMSSIACCS